MLTTALNPSFVVSSLRLLVFERAAGPSPAARVACVGNGAGSACRPTRRPSKSSSQLGLQGSQEMKDQQSHYTQDNIKSVCSLSTTVSKHGSHCSCWRLGSGVSSSRLRLLGSSSGKRYLWAHPRLFSLNVARSSLVAIVSDKTERHKLNLFQMLSLRARSGALARSASGLHWQWSRERMPSN